MDLVPQSVVLWASQTHGFPQHVPITRAPFVPGLGERGWNSKRSGANDGDVVWGDRSSSRSGCRMGCRACIGLFPEKGVRRQDARHTRGKPTVVIVRSVWDQVRNRAFLLTPTPLRRRLGLYWAIKWMICFREEKYYWWLDPPVLWFASLKLELRDTHWFRLKCRTRTMGFYRQRAPHCHSAHDAAAVKVLHRPPFKICRRYSPSVIKGVNANN